MSLRSGGMLTRINFASIASIRSAQNWQVWKIQLKESRLCCYLMKYPPTDLFESQKLTRPWSADFDDRPQGLRFSNLKVVKDKSCDIFTFYRLLFAPGFALPILLTGCFCIGWYFPRRKMRVCAELIGKMFLREIRKQEEDDFEGCVKKKKHRKNCECCPVSKLIVR